MKSARATSSLRKIENISMKLKILHIRFVASIQVEYTERVHE